MPRLADAIYRRMSVSASSRDSPPIFFFFFYRDCVKIVCAPGAGRGVDN